MVLGIVITACSAMLIAPIAAADTLVGEGNATGNKYRGSVPAAHHGTQAAAS